MYKILQKSLTSPEGRHKVKGMQLFDRIKDTIFILSLRGLCFNEVEARRR